MAQVETLTTVWDARFDKLEAKLNQVVRANYGAAAKVEAAWGGLNDNIAKSAGKSTAGLKSFSLASLSAAAGAAAASAAIAGLGAAYAGALKAAKFADDIADTSKRLGISTDALQEYRYALHALGGEYADADRALDSFAEKFGAAHGGLTRNANKPFAALGLDAKDYKTTEAALAAVTDKISKLGTTAEQAAAAAKLGLRDMLPLLQAGTSGFEKARAAAHRLGAVMDADVVQKGGDAADKLEDLATILSVQVNSALIDLTPLIIGVGNGFVAVASAVREVGRWLDALNNWAPSSALLGIMDQAGNAGAALGKSLGTDRVGDTAFGRSLSRFLGGASGPPRVTVAGIEAALADKTPKTGTLIPQNEGRSRAARQIQDNTAERVEQVNAILARSGETTLQAMAGLTENIEARAAIEQEIAQQQHDAAIADLNRQIAKTQADKTIRDEAVRRDLIAKLEIAKGNEEEAAAARKAAALREAGYAIEDRQIEIYEAIVEAQLDQYRAQAEVATTAEERNRIQKRILELEQQLARDVEGTKIDRRVAKGELTPKQGATFKQAMEDRFGAESDTLRHDQRGPLAQYLDSIGDLDTAFQELEANGIRSLIDGLAAASVGAADLGDVFRSTIRQMAMDANKALLENVLHSATGEGGWLSGLLKIGASAVKGGGGGILKAIGGNKLSPKFAAGTDSAPGGLALIGERGPEILNIPRGAQVIPNDILRKLATTRAPGGPAASARPVTINFSVVTPDAKSFSDRKSQSQIMARLRGEIAQTARKGY